MIEILVAMFLAPIIGSLPVAFAWLLDPKPEWARRLPIFAVLGLFVSLFCALQILFSSPIDKTIKISVSWLPEFNINFVFIFDYLSKIMGVLTALIAFLIGVYGLEYMKKDYRLGWYWFFFNLFTASMLLVVYSDNLLLLLIGWEGLGLASWGLIGHWFRDDDEMSFVGNVGRKIAGMNYFWPPSLGGWRAISTIRVGDMPMFFAIAAIFFFTGTLNISEIHWEDFAKEVGSFGVFIIIFLFLLGPFTKSAQLPFSEWLMTAMTGPTTVSALLHSATMVAAGTYLFMRLSWYIEPWNIHSEGIEAIYIIALFLGLISALYGASVALGCLERKVLLAASTMSSLGLMFATTAASAWVGKIAVLVGFWYLVTHAFAKATLFLVAGHLIHETHDRFCVGGKEIAKKLKLAFTATIIATLCLSGIPPLTAYWVKSAMDGVMHGIEHHFGYTPLVLLVLTSAVYSAFLAKFLSLNFLKGKEVEIHPHGGRLMSLAYMIMALMLFFLLYLYLAEHGFTKYHEFTHFLEEGFLMSSFAVGIIVLISYVVTLYKPRLESPISKAFGDRLYIPFLNDFIIPKIGWAFAKFVDYCNRLIDLICHQAVPYLFRISSLGVRSIQSGSVERYVKIVVAIVLLIFLISAGFGVIL
ncbi:MAG: NADH-quinone oxidoreductase subunit L [Archaeoglobaceae archaeon]|nr:NADH-quinone oxidoreductase subunit L [Archaeoglobaceae archaeon]MDW8117592.1 NADH-quinone oxidoreductase subunit L [Archaeoglobaceae archaeon]